MPTRFRRCLLAVIVATGLSLWSIRPALAVEPTLTGLTLTPGVLTLTTDQTATFTLTGTYSDATSKDVTELATWLPNGSGLTGIPNQKSNFTAVAVGAWTMTASVGGLSASAAVTITHGAPVALTLMPTPASVTADDLTPLRLFATDADGNGWDVTTEATWTTSETTGKVDSTGYQPAVPGTWNVTGALGTLTVVRTFTVTAGVVESVTITPAAVRTVDLGSTTQLEATAYDAHGNVLPSSITWSVTNPDLGSVTTNGVFTATAPGQTHVIASVGNVQSINSIIIQGGSVIGTENDPEIIAVTRPAATSRTPRVAAEEVEKQPEVTTPVTETTTTPTVTKTNFPHPWIIVLILAHAITLAGYFTWLIRRASRWWWAPPIITTGILLAVYSAAFLKGTYLWWPWTAIGLTIVFVSVYYQRYGPQPSSTGNAPPGQPQ